MENKFKSGDKVFVIPEQAIGEKLNGQILTVKENYPVNAKQDVYKVRFEEIDGWLYSWALCRVEENHPMYYMALNQKINMGHYDIKRVPGGWLYSYTNKIAFVPFNDEFLVR